MTPRSMRIAVARWRQDTTQARSEEHTSELQSPCNLVCRLLLEKKKNHQHSKHHLGSSRTSPAHGSKLVHVALHCMLLKHASTPLAKVGEQHVLALSQDSRCCND